LMPHRIVSEVVRVSQHKKGDSMVTAQITYGAFQRGHSYELLAEGCDWYLVKANGGGVYGFKWIFEE
jgi:hypothetical protein